MEDPFINLLERKGRKETAEKLKGKAELVDTRDEKKEMDLMARLSKEAYNTDRKNIGDFIYQPYQSTKKRAFYFNPKTQEYIISQRGTDPKDLQDLNDDGLIAGGNLDRSRRYKEEKKFIEFLKKRGNKNIKLVGHSLGGTLSKELARELDLPATVFSAGEGLSKRNLGQNIRERMEGRRSKIKSYKTIYDPVSFLNVAGYVVPMKKGINNPHALDHYLMDEEKEEMKKELKGDEMIINNLLEEKE